jgi:hypothetical protein
VKPGSAWRAYHRCCIGLYQIKAEMADHSLVRELGRSLDVRCIEDFSKWTAGTYITVATTSALDAFATGLIATAAGGAATVALEALRSRRAGQETARASEFYYLYEANRRLA